MTPEERERWEAAYNLAEYQVMLESVTLTLRIGQYDAETERKLVAGTGVTTEWYIVTPCNPRSQMARAELNLYYLEQLRYEVGGRAGNSFHTLNRDPSREWPDEPGFLLADADRVWVMDLGRRFHQNALVTARLGEAPRLLWLD